MEWSLCFVLFCFVLFQLVCSFLHPFVPYFIDICVLNNDCMKLWFICSVFPSDIYSGYYYYFFFVAIMGFACFLIIHSFVCFSQ